MSAREPLRLVDPGAGAAPELAAALRAFRSQHGSEAQVRALRERLGPELAAPTIAGSAVAKLLWVKLLLGGLLPLALSWSALSYLARSVPEDATPTSSGPAVSVATTRAVPQRSALASASEAHASEAPASALTAPSPPSALPSHAKPARVQPARRAAPAPERELALLQRAQAALDRSPSTVLELTAQHEREYASGIFAQEREILAIEALLELGRHPAARARAERFVQRFEGSPHMRRVRALLERTRASNTQTTQRATGDSSGNVQP